MLNSSTIVQDNEGRIDSARAAVKTHSEIGKQATAKEAASRVADQFQFESLISAENAQLSDLKQAEDKFQQSMVMMVAELDSETVGMDVSLKKLQETDSIERFVGFFSKTKSAEMREKRIRNHSLQDNLNEVIKLSDIIGELLTEQRENVHGRLVVSRDNLKETVELRRQTKVDLENIAADIADTYAEIENLQAEIDTSDSPAEQATLEVKLTELQDKHQANVDKKKLLLARDQNFDRLFKHYKAHVDSLGTMLANQDIMIDLLSTDVKNRVDMVESFLTAIKTNDQQMIAHNVNQLGKHTDISMHEQMNAMKTVSDDQFAAMVERHSKHMDRVARTDGQSANASEVFKARLNEVLRQQQETQNQ